MLSTKNKNKVSCSLCPINCLLGPDEVGACQVRGNVDGEMRLLTYGKVTTIAVGPVEQKPLYHFFPGMRVMSIGGSGCNMSCGYCQNFSVSQVSRIKQPDYGPEAVVEMAKAHGAKAIAFTYSEPLMWFEYVLDVAWQARAAGLKTILKTNGYVNQSFFEEACKLMDAVNVDVKGSAVLYDKICGIHMSDNPSDWVIMKNLTSATAMCHLEISTIVIPGYGDLERVFQTILDAVYYPDVPLHLLRFVPDFRMRGTRPPADDEMEEAAFLARQYFDFVYSSSIANGTETHCPFCDTRLISRNGLEVERNSVSSGQCLSCGHFLNLVA